MSNERPTGRRNRWQWAAIGCLGLGLIANAAAMFYGKRSGTGYPAEFTFEQVARGQGTVGTPVPPSRGLYVMPAQLGPNTFGLYLLDLDAGNIVVYKAIPEANRFHLMAARNYRNDRFLEDLNNDSPTPKEVQKIVQQQRQREALEGKQPETVPPVQP